MEAVRPATPNLLKTPSLKPFPAKTGPQNLKAEARASKPWKEPRKEALREPFRVPLRATMLTFFLGAPFFGIPLPGQAGGQAAAGLSGQRCKVPGMAEGGAFLGLQWPLVEIGLWGLWSLGFGVLELVLLGAFRCSRVQGFRASGLSGDVLAKSIAAPTLPGPRSQYDPLVLF